MKTLRELKTDFVILNSHSTGLELYRFLYKNLDKVIVLDDIMALFDNKSSVGLLLAALWNPSGVRKINWNSSTSKLKDVPTSFIFKGKIIILLNDFPEKYQALKSRGIYYELELSYKQVIKAMREISKAKNIPNEIVDYIEQITNEASDLNFRDLIKAYNIYLADSENWKHLVADQLKVDPDMLFLYNLVNSSLAVRDQISKWIEIGHSRADYFRKKKLIETAKCQNLSSRARNS